MWRAYYDRRRIALFLQLGDLLREQYKMSWVRSQMAAYHAARAAVVFQNGRGRPDYEHALPDLEAYYGSIRTRSSAPFEVKEAARRELEWWIVHRERARYGKERLVQTLADLQAAVYGMPADRFRKHAEARAEAMLIRDDRAAAGGVSDGDWARIHSLLDESWTSLWQAVQR